MLFSRPATRRRRSMLSALRSSSQIRVYRRPSLLGRMRRFLRGLPDPRVS